MDNFWPFFAFVPFTSIGQAHWKKKKVVKFLRIQQRIFWGIGFRLFVVSFIGRLGCALFKDSLMPFLCLVGTLI